MHARSALAQEAIIEGMEDPEPGLLILLEQVADETLHRTRTLAILGFSTGRG